VKRKYGALRVIALVLTILAWIVLILGVLVSILGGVFGADALSALDIPGGTYAAIVIIVGIIISVVYFLILLGAAQLIYLLMDVERNTRETAYRLRTGRREPLEPFEE
jgi:uncharacterized BrkB/YihY/UPF0761 family membrane protein